jgi:hypothetical protein
VAYIRVSPSLTRKGLSASIRAACPSKAMPAADRNTDAARLEGRTARLTRNHRVKSPGPAAGRTSRPGQRRADSEAEGRFLSDSFKVQVKFVVVALAKLQNFKLQGSEAVSAVTASSWAIKIGAPAASISL